MLAARHYWNTSLPLIRQKLDRELLKEPLSVILQCITETMDKQKYKRAKVGRSYDYQRRPVFVRSSSDWK